MTDLRKAAEMALEALRNAEIVKMEQLEAMYALQEALAQPEQEPVSQWYEGYNKGFDTGVALAQPEQEPVAWADKVGAVIPHSHKLFQPDLLKDYTRPLYTAPPKREWVGLTDEEIDALHMEIKVRLMGTYNTKDIYRAIEAKLKEKNS